MNEEETIKAVTSIFIEYLTIHGHRKTLERMMILTHVYSMEGHFDLEKLYESMNGAGFHVSRATIYNTIVLLLDCRLVLKHQFGKNVSFYEKNYNNDSHHHLICTECGLIREITDVNVKQSINNNKRIAKFNLSYYCLYMYGVCNKCSGNESTKKSN
jgi:Fur family ferric uptake transcriptional regulator